MIPFGKRLKAVRVLRGLKQDELAEMAGLARTTVLKIEKDQTWPEKRTVEALETTLGLQFFDPEVTRAFDLLAAESNSYPEAA